MAGERERHALRHVEENIGLVRQQDHRIVGGDLRERAGQIVHAAEAAGADAMRDLVAETGEPEALARLAEQHASFSMQRNAHIGERLAHAFDVEPPIVIAVDGVDAERRLQAREFGRPGGVRYVLGDERDGWRNSRPSARSDRS